jgi:pimeloyl-ACP methyl ester carboxylesterase
VTDNVVHDPRSNDLFMPHAALNGTTLHYERAGSGTPALVFVHGFGCAHEDWRHQVGAFAGQHGVVACDLRGHGASPGDPGGCNIETYGADVVALLAALDLTEVVLVGHSMGCRVVLQAYAEAPERIVGLAVIDGSSAGAGGERAVEAARARVAAGYSAFARSLFTQMFFTPGPEADRLIKRGLALPEPIGATLWLSMVGWDARRMTGALESVRVPLLVIQSTAMSPERGRVPLAAGGTSPWLELVRRHAPGSEIEIVPGVGHFAMLEAPDRMNAALAAFIERLAGSR